MGCDGGTIPKRNELVKVKQKPVRLDPKLALDAKWRHCHLSNQPLATPIVACELGRLYNKEAVISYLLRQVEAPPEHATAMRHIRSLKDVIQLQLTTAPDFDPASGGVPWVCPVTSLEMNGSHRFLYMRPCGCVISEKAAKEVPSETCHKCANPIEDMIVLNGEPEEVAALQEKMAARRKAAKAEKKAKKAAAAQAADAMPPPSQPKAANGDTVSKKRPADTPAEHPQSKVPRKEPKKMQINPVIPVQANEAEWAFSGKSMQDNPKASSNLKSLFLSSVPEKKLQSSYTSRTTYSGYW